ncbi:hypothetical protein TELCIR_19953, partial [Teladorsagia circumcincta]
MAALRVDRYRDDLQRMQSVAPLPKLEHVQRSSGNMPVTSDPHPFKAIVLSEYLATHPDLVRGHRVLELGAGLGLPSIVAAKLSGKSVVATDQPSAISLLRENIAANLREEEMSAVSIVPLDWANLPEEPLSADIILGADLVYNEEVFEALRKVITKLITTDNVMLMASKIRYPKDKRFYETLRDDFDVTQ